MLALEEGPFLQSAGRTVFPLRDIEDDGMGMELRSGIAVHRTGGVVLELSCDELPRSFGGIVAADPRLCVPLQFFQGGAYGGAVCLPHPLITADQRGKRDGFGSGERRIPARPMLNRVRCRAIRVLVIHRYAVPDHLLLSLWMNSFRKPRELQGSDLSLKSERSGELSLPLALHLIALAVIALGFSM